MNSYPKCDDKIKVYIELYLLQESVVFKNWFLKKEETCISGLPMINWRWRNGEFQSPSSTTGE